MFLLFESLLKRSVPAVVVRVLCFSYQEQLALVKWGRTTTSSPFRISNGTRQGSVASPCFWSVYLDPLFTRLREAAVGCTIAVGVWCGVVGYADDLILLSPSRSAAQKMLKICEDFASDYSVCKLMYLSLRLSVRQLTLEKRFISVENLHAWTSFVF